MAFAVFFCFCDQMECLVFMLLLTSHQQLPNPAGCVLIRFMHRYFILLQMALWNELNSPTGAWRPAVAQ
jgi:hypothetical protein